MRCANRLSDGFLGVTVQARGRRPVLRGLPRHPPALAAQIEGVALSVKGSELLLEAFGFMRIMERDRHQIAFGAGRCFAARPAGFLAIQPSTNVLHNLAKERIL